MILLTNGCSWTYGGGLGLDNLDQTEERLKKVWPYHLGQLLSASTIINLSDGCGSNYRTTRTTYDWVLSQSQETLENTVAVIQWTELSRYEFYMPRFKNDIDGWIKCKVGVVASHLSRPEITDLIYEYNDRRLSLYTDLEGMYNLLYCCESLDSLFRRFGVKYYFWNMWANHRNDSYIPEIYKEYFSRFNWFENYSDWSYDRISKEDQHPSFQGHKDLAKIMFEQMSK